MTAALDRRLNAFRSDLADERLRGKVEAKGFVAGQATSIAVPVCDVFDAPTVDAGMTSQMVLGEPVTVFEIDGHWAWLQSRRDGYVGYVSAAALGADDVVATHRVLAPRTFVYERADLKLRRLNCLSAGSEVAVTGTITERGTKYAMLGDGSALIANHLLAIDQSARDFVAVAETFLHTPYLWGGSTGFGIDCSGLVQRSMQLAGHSVLRDSDMQADTIGSAVGWDGPSGNLQRGDLVFWKGHVGIMVDRETLLHANAHTMTVARESLADAVERIGYLYGDPTMVRRPY